MCPVCIVRKHLTCIGITESYSDGQPMGSDGLLESNHPASGYMVHKVNVKGDAGPVSHAQLPGQHTAEGAPRHAGQA